MKKKFISALLSAAMVTAMLTACGSSTDTSTADDTTQTADAEETTAAEEVTAGEIPDAWLHYTFDEGADEGYTAVVRVDDVGGNTGATYGIEATDDDYFQYAAGPVGDALYLDGYYGVDLNMDATNTDAYTISFWYNAYRMGDYGPTLQIGYDIGMAADSGNNVTWLNVTQSSWGADSATIFPILWSRNEASDAQDGTDCWPWMYGFDDSVHGVREWVMVTVVVSGEEQNPLPGSGSTGVGAQLYLNGELVYDSAECYSSGTMDEWAWDATVAPNIMQPGSSTFESWFGINYWDTVFRGFVDDLWVFDSALDAGQVLALYELGDGSVTSDIPESTAAEEEEEETEAYDNSAVEAVGTTLGTNACDDAFWTVFTDVWEVAEGESVTKTFTNYTDGLYNWDNFLVILQNVAAGHSADDDADYAEYAVLRADNFGWGDGYDAAALECDWNWDTFAADINGAQIELTVTNNGGTTDVSFTATTADGAVYTQSYTGVATDGDVYFCLTLEKAFLNDIQ